MTLDQQKAVAIATARLRLQQSQGQPPAPDRGTVSVDEAKAAFAANRPGIVSRFANEFIDTGVGMAKGLYHAATDPATPEEMKTFGNQPGPAELLLKRTLIDPSVQNYEKMKAAPNLSGKIGYGLGMIPVAGPLGTSLGETAADKGLPEAAGQAAMYAVAPKVIEKGMDVAGAIADRAPAAIANAPKTASDFLRDRFKPKPEVTMLRATGSSNPNLPEKIPAALDELGAWSDETGKPVSSVPQARQAIDERMTQYNKLSDKVSEPVKDVVVPGSRAELAKAKIDAIPDEVRLNKPKQYANLVKSINDAAEAPDYTIGDLNDLRKDLQAKNKAYGKNLSGQIAAEHSNQAIDAAAEHYARGKFYDALSEASGDSSVKEIKGRIGAMIELDNALRPRVNQSMVESGKPFMQRAVETAGKALTPGTTLKHFGEGATIDSDIASAVRQWQRRPALLTPGAPKVPVSPLTGRMALPPPSGAFHIDPSAGELYGQPSAADRLRGITRTPAEPGGGFPMRDVTPPKQKMLPAAPLQAEFVDEPLPQPDRTGKTWNMPPSVKAMGDEYLRKYVPSQKTAADALRSRTNRLPSVSESVVDGMAKEHMKLFADVHESGIGKLNGKAKIKYSSVEEAMKENYEFKTNDEIYDEGGFRFSLKKGTPWEAFSDKSAAMAKAARQGKGPLYQRMLKAAKDFYRNALESEIERKLHANDRQFNKETAGWD